MDLTTVEYKLAASGPKPKGRADKGKYADKDEVVRDFERVWNNSVKFNGPDHLVSLAGLKLEEAFDKAMRGCPPDEVVSCSLPPLSTSPPRLVTNLLSLLSSLSSSDLLPLLPSSKPTKPTRPTLTVKPNLRLPLLPPTLPLDEPQSRTELLLLDETRKSTVDPSERSTLPSRRISDGPREDRTEDPEEEDRRGGRAEVEEEGRRSKGTSR